MSNPLEEDQNPLTYTPSALVNPFGEYFAVDETDPDQAIPGAGDPGVGVGSSIQTVFTSGLYNADFQNGPAGGVDSVISDQNPIPYWRFVSEVGGSIKARWIEDSASPSGHAVQWEVSANPGAGDKAYLEQVIPVSSREYVRYIVMRVGTATANSAGWYRELQCFDASGTATGSAVSGSQWPTDQAGPDTQVYLPIESDARYVRVRVGVDMDASPSSTNTLVMHEVWCDKVDPIITSFVCADDVTPATGTQGYYVVSAAADGTPGGAAGRFIAPADGWVLAVTVRLDDLRTSGTLEFQCRNETWGFNNDPAAVINATYDQYAWSTLAGYIGGPFAAYHPSTNYFKAGDVLRVRGTVTSGTFAPTTAGAVIHVLVAMLPAF